MSRIGRMLPLGAALMIASCTDSTGPPQTLEQQPLGAISGGGISTAELHPLRHRMTIVSQDGLPLLQEVAQSTAGVPQLESYDLNFWAKRGEPRGVEVHYISEVSGTPADFLLFHVPANALKQRPDGTPFAIGDSVLISICIDKEEFVVEFGPSGLVFDDITPAELGVWYSGAEGEFPQEQLGLWHQQEVDQLWFPIRALNDTAELWLRTNVFHFSTYAVSW